LRVAAFSARLLLVLPSPFFQPAQFSYSAQSANFARPSFLFDRFFVKIVKKRVRFVGSPAKMTQNDRRRVRVCVADANFCALGAPSKRKKRPKIAKNSKKAAFFPIFSRTNEKKATFGAALA